MTCKCPIVSYAWFQSIVHSNHALKFLPPGARLYCHMSNVMWTSKLTSLFLCKTHLLNSNHQNGHLHNFEMIGVVHYTYCRDMTNSNENDIVAFLIFDICDLSWQQTNIEFKICQWVDSNRGPLVSETTTLTIEPQPTAPA